MKKYVLVMLFLLTLTTGCQSLSQKTMMLLDEPIAEVNVSKSMGYGEINEDHLFSFHNDETIKIFEKAILGAKSIDSKAAVTEPEYDIVVVYKDELPSHAIYLWLGDENEESIMMYLTDEETAYVTSTKATNQLRALILE